MAMFSVSTMSTLEGIPMARKSRDERHVHR